MAGASDRKVLIALDGSEQSDHAFECKLTNFRLASPAQKPHIQLLIGLQCLVGGVMSNFYVL